MAGDERGIVCEIEACLALEHPHRRKRYRHQRGLGILRQGEPLRRSVPHDGAQLVAERLVHLVEHLACCREGLGERLPHADGLTALPRKNECDGHAYPSENMAVYASSVGRPVKLEKKVPKAGTFRQLL